MRFGVLPARTERGAGPSWSGASFHFTVISQVDETLPAHRHPTRYAVIRHGNLLKWKI
jgi:hypothetical protein